MQVHITHSHQRRTKTLARATCTTSALPKRHRAVLQTTRCTILNDITDDLPTDLGDHEWRTKVLPSCESHAPGGPSCDNHVSLSHHAPPRNTSNNTVRIRSGKLFHRGVLRVSASSKCQIRISVNITWQYIKWLTLEMGSPGNRNTGKLDLNSLRKYILLRQKKESEKLGDIVKVLVLYHDLPRRRESLRHVWACYSLLYCCLGQLACVCFPPICVLLPCHMIYFSLNNTMTQNKWNTKIQNKWNTKTQNKWKWNFSYLRKDPLRCSWNIRYTCSNHMRGFIGEKPECLTYSFQSFCVCVCVHVHPYVASWASRLSPSALRPMLVK